MEKLTKFIKEVGFHAFVCIVLLYILFTTLETNNRTLEHLCRLIERTHPQNFSVTDSRESHLPK